MTLFVDKTTLIRGNDLNYDNFEEDKIQSDRMNSIEEDEAYDYYDSITSTSDMTFLKSLNKHDHINPAIIKRIDTVIFHHPHHGDEDRTDDDDANILKNDNDELNDSVNFFLEPDEIDLEKLKLEVEQEDNLFVAQLHDSGLGEPSKPADVEILNAELNEFIEYKRVKSKAKMKKTVRFAAKDIIIEIEPDEPIVVNTNPFKSVNSVLNRFFDIKPIRHVINLSKTSSSSITSSSNSLESSNQTLDNMSSSPSSISTMSAPINSSSSSPFSFLQRQLSKEKTPKKMKTVDYFKMKHAQERRSSSWN